MAGHHIVNRDVCGPPRLVASGDRCFPETCRRGRRQSSPVWLQAATAAPIGGAVIGIVLCRQGQAMKLPRRRFLQFAGAAAAAPAFYRVAAAQTYPSRPITMIVPLPAGSALDTIGRLLAERIRSSLGQPVIIENVTGADGNFGTGRAAHARPDGYTIDLGYQGPNVLNGAFYSLSYDVLNDFVPISPLATTPSVLYARKTMPGKDLKELIAWMKANPNKASLGSLRDCRAPPMRVLSKRNWDNNLPSFPIVASPSRTWWPVRLICLSIR